MPLHLSWEQVALRLALASIAGFLIGLNRDEHGHPAGIRTTMLVCLAAALAMVQVNLMLPLVGKSSDSFVVMDLMRLPLGILSGIGFIGAGVIVKRGADITGVTTAACMWVVTVLGLLFGGGNIYLGIAGSIVVLIVLWLFKYIEGSFAREYRGRLRLWFSERSTSEEDLRGLLKSDDLSIVHWKVQYDNANNLTSLECEVKWRSRDNDASQPPLAFEQLRALPGVYASTWDE